MACRRHGAVLQPRPPKFPVTNTPSTDGVPQNTGPADIIHPLYAANGWVEGDTSMPIDGAGASTAGRMSRPPTAAARDRSADISRQSIRAACPRIGLEILLFAKCDRIDFDSHGTAVAVNYTERASLDQSDPGVGARRA